MLAVSTSFSRLPNNPSHRGFKSGFRISRIKLQHAYDTTLNSIWHSQANIYSLTAHAQRMTWHKTKNRMSKDSTVNSVN